MNIILCGLPKTGKTTIGKKVAEQLIWNFIDTDRLIENAYTNSSGKVYTCREILRSEGNLFFRELEKEQISLLKQSTKNVFSVGGGSLCDKENTLMLKKLGDLIYLKSPINVLWDRLLKSGIPAYLDPNKPKEDFYELAKIRIPIYEEAASFIIDTSDLNEQQVVDAILNNRKMYYGK